MALGLWGLGFGRLIPAVVFGAGLMLSSLLLQRLATGWVLRGENQTLGMLIVFSKLGLVFLVTYLALSAAWVDPVGFTTGVTTLLVALVLDVCYRQRATRQRAARVD